MIRLVELSLRRPGRVVLAAVIAAVLGVVGLAVVQTTASTDTIVGGGSQAARADREVAQRFGGDPIVVLVRERVTELVLTGELSRLVGLEGCLSGRVPRGATPAGGPNGPCGRLTRLRAAEIVYGPGTFINTSAQQIADQLQVAQRQAAEQVRRAREAATQLARRQGRSAAVQRAAADQAQQAVQAQLVRRLLSLQRYGINPARPPSLSDQSFVAQLVFDNGADVAGTPKRRFAALFPNASTAAIQVRLRDGLSQGERREALDAVNAAVRMPQWRLQQGGTYEVTGQPVLVESLRQRMERSLLVLLGTGILAMGIALAIAFPVRRRLLPLAVAAGTVAVVGGALGLLRVPLSLGTLATLPVLLGLGVDYGVQLQSRIEARRRRGEDPESAVRGAVAGTGRAVLVATAATLAGFVALLLSPTPLVRGFALLLMIGVALAVLAAFTVGIAVPQLLDRRTARVGGPSPVAASWAEAVRMLSRLAPSGLARRIVSFGGRRHRAVLVVGGVLAVVGWGLSAGADVETDVQRLAPQNLPALQGIQELQRSSGVAGEVTVLVTGQTTSPAALRWMADYRRRVLTGARYTEERGCGRADLCPALSLTDVFRSDASRTSTTAVARLLDGLPDYFSRGVISADRRAGVLRFGIRLASAEDQARIIAAMRRQLDPPTGVQATVTGLPVLVAEAAEDTSDPWLRLGLTALGLLLVAVVLRALLGTWRRAVLPLVPIAMATGWSGLLIWALEPLGVRLNPLSALLGALVVAIATEFSVLLTERHRRQRAAGATQRRAVAETLEATGRAVGVSAFVAAMGFAVLVLSDVPLLRDFGFLTVLDLLVAVLAVALVLPALAGEAEARAARRRAAEPQREATLA